MPQDRDSRRAKSPPLDVAEQLAAPDVEFDDCTGKYEGEELKEMRRKRPVSERVDRLEDKHDDLKVLALETAQESKKTAMTVARIEGVLGAQDKTLERIEAQLRDKQVEHTTFRMAQIDVSKEQAKATISDAADEKKMARLDALESKQTRNKLILLIAGAVFSAGVVSAIVQHFLGKI